MKQFSVSTFYYKCFKRLANESEEAIFGPRALSPVIHRGERDCLGGGRPEVCQSSSNLGGGGGSELSSNITPMAEQSISIPSKCYGKGSGIRDPVPFLPLDPGSGMGKNQDPDPGSGMNNPDHISESMETIFWVKILKFFDADPGSGVEKIRIQDPG
jgi:hypothetical protein